MSAETQLAVVPPKETAMAVFSAEKGLEPWLQQIRTEIDGFTPDVSTRKGRDAVASMAYKVARSKTALDDVGKKLVAELKEIPKKIDAERKRVRDTLDAWQEEVRRPLNEWQAAEDARVDRHESRIKQLRDLVDIETLFAEGIRFKIANAESVVVDEGFEEFEPEAHRVKALTLASLRESLAKQEKYEAEQDELARLRAEAEERAKADREAAIAKEAAERAMREAEQKAQVEREAVARRERETAEAAERRELELKLQAEQSARAAEKAEADRIAVEKRAEQELINAVQRAEMAAEHARIEERRRAEAEAAEIARQQAAREADRAHKSAIYKAAKEAFMQNGMTEDCARLAVKLIASNMVPNIKVTY